MKDVLQFFTKELTGLVFGVLCFANQCLAQYPAPELERPAIQSPDASNLGKYGEIPISLFNGRVNISIPLFKITNKEIDIPISLSYDAGGNRPDQHPTSNGLGWTLLAGGVIKRQINGTADEVGFGTNNYFNNYSILNNSNWATSSFYDNLKLGLELSPDEFSFNVNGVSGYFMLNHEGKWVVRSNDPSISVEVEKNNNYQLLNLKGGKTMTLPRVITKIILTTKDGTKYIFGGDQSAIEFSMPSLPEVIEPYNMDPKAIDHHITYCSLLQTTCVEVTRNVIASAWHLTQIISPTADVISFEYESKLNLQQTRYTTIAKQIKQTSSNRTFYTYDINQVDKTLLISSNLKKIICNNGLICEFNKSLSNELKWVYNRKPQSYDYFYPYDYFFESTPWEYFKLDNIVLKYQSILINKVSFKYIENVNERLKLEKISILDRWSSGTPIQEYSFSYNLKKLPTYNAGLDDHWGYYNGKNFWGGVSKQSETAIPNLNDYYNSREPDPNYMDAEIIDKIYYPTGGFSKFYFEPHSYSMQLNQNPNLALENLNQNYIAGGLRIKKIETYESSSATPIVKEYFYLKNYINAGQLSSGVLSGKPYYYNNIISNSYGSVERFSSSPLNFLNTTNGDHITYSEITEKKDEGYIVYKYTNHDNGYLDKPYFAKISEDKQSVFDFKLFGKLDLERGQLKSIQIYHNNKSLLKETVNTYNDDPNRYNIYVRSSQLTQEIRGNRVMFPIYTFRTFLKKEEVKEYSTDGTYITTVSEFQYDDVNNIVWKNIINSKQKIIKEEYKYPYDFPSNTILQEMSAKHILNKVVEAKKSEDNVQKDFTRIDFYSPNPEIYKPKTISTQLRNTDPVEARIQFDNYDVKGNILQQKKQNDHTQSFEWGYNGLYPIAEVKNALNTAPVYTTQTTTNTYNIPESSPNSGFSFTSSGGTIKIRLNISPGYTYGMQYNLTGPGNGLGSLCASGSSTTCSLPQEVTFTGMPAGNYSLSLTQSDGSVYIPRSVWYQYDMQTVSVPAIKEFFFDGFEENPSSNAVTGTAHSGRKYWNTSYTTSFTKPNSRNYVIQWWNLSGGKWIFNEQPFTTNVTLTGPVDDVRIFPKDAFMTSYTYDPLIGMTSQTDPSGKVITYEYDSFGRLKTIKDKDGNVLKTMDYQYQKPYNQ
ncbi:MAG: RHS repeat protein [Agriterribacter sp.]